jgi:hypothetical protein
MGKGRVAAALRINGSGILLRYSSRWRALVVFVKSAAGISYVGGAARRHVSAAWRAQRNGIASLSRRRAYYNINIAGMAKRLSDGLTALRRWRRIVVAAPVVARHIDDCAARACR